MNLVKAQELAKELSIPELQKYANGSNPEMMPPYIALGALQAKELMAKKMQAMQGAAQGEQPSIKEQVEQKAGLMALQGQQQQQAQQQMAQQMQGRPMPAPEGVPQPDQQPEEMPMGMAHGGIARLPVQFSFEEGGIIGYAGPEGSQVVDPFEEAKARSQQALAKLRTYGLRQRQQDPEGYASAEQEYEQAQKAKDALERQVTGGPAGLMGQSIPAAPVSPVVKPPVVAETVTQKPQVGLPAALPTGQSSVPAAPKPPSLGLAAPVAPTAPVAPAAPATPEIGQATTTPNQEQLIAEEAARRKAFGADTEIGAGAESRMGERRKRFEESRPTGLQDLIRFLSESSQSKGFTGMGPAYLSGVNKKRADEAAFEAEMETQQTGIEDKRRAEGVGRATGIGAGLATSREQERQAKEARERNLTSVEVAKINAASANRPGEVERMTAEYLRRKAKDPADAAQYLAASSQFRSGIPGGKGTMTRNEAQDNVSNLMKDIQTQMDMKKEAAEALKVKNPKISEVIEYHVQKMMGATGADKPVRLKFDAAGKEIK